MTDKPLYPEEFVGWRGWRIVNGLLTSVNDDFVWEPGDYVQAVCSKGHKLAPTKGCACGLYAVEKYAKLVRNNYHLYDAYGKVSCWGEIVPGTLGLKSQFAYPRVIYVAHLNWRFVDDLQKYGVPVKVSNPFNLKNKES